MTGHSQFDGVQEICDLKATRVSRNRLPLGFLLAIILVLAACGGSDKKSTPTAVVQSTPTPAPTVAASPPPNCATPHASPVASPQASPVAAASISREEFQCQLLTTFPMTPAAHKGGTVVLGESGDISTLNGLLARDTPTLYITGAIYEGLIGLSPVDGRIVPSLADSWDVSPDGLTYTFHLNKKAKWHDGVDFTADDVAFSFDAALDPNTGTVFRTILHDAVESYRVIDPDTFEIKARDRLVTFMTEGVGSVTIMPKHIWQNVGFDAWSFDGGSTGKDPSRVIGTGPFKFKEWVQGDHVTIVRNDDYYDVVPNIDALTLQVQPNAESAVLALQNKAIDVLEVIPPEQTEAVQNTPGMKVDIYDFNEATQYVFNLDPARTTLFTDPAVRQALYYALDRNSITKNIYLGFGEPAVGTQPPLSPGYAPDQMTPDYAFDPAKAKQMLADAGWTDSNGDGVVDKDGQKMKFELIYQSGATVVDQLVSYMQEAWKAVGVDMEPRATSDMLSILDKHDFEMALLAFQLGTDGSQTILYSCSAYDNGLNFGKFCDQNWDALDQQQRREFDPAKRGDLLVQQSEIVWQQQPVGMIRFGVARTGYNIRLHNFYPNGYGFLWSLPYVWVDG
jgi:peptide/nickel transport system substrate-binding protein